MGKPNTPGCGDGGGCCVPGECVLGTDEYARADESPVTGWTAIDGTWSVASGVLVPSGANARIRYDGASTPSARVGMQVKIKGNTGDRLAVELYVDATTYVRLEVLIGASGRFEYTDAVQSPTYTYQQTEECIDGVINVPAGEWHTLTVLWVERTYDGCHTAFDNFGTFNAILQTSAGTHRMAMPAPHFGLTSAYDVTLATGATAASASFNDFVLFSPVDPCDTQQTCCIASNWPIEAEDGWTESSEGQWTYSTPDYVAADTILGLLTLDETYWNDNLSLSVGIGTTESAILDETFFATWRLYFSKQTGGNFYAEMRGPYFDNDGITLPWFEYRLYDYTTLLAWMDLYVIGGATQDWPASLATLFTLGVEVYDCKIYWGFSSGESCTDHICGFAVYGGLPGSELFFGITPFAYFCAGDSFSLNHTGEVGVGTGTTVVGELTFFDFSTACSADFDCEEPPDTEPPGGGDPDPGDPTGCCTGTGWDDLELGDAVEISVSGITYWFGAGCADPDCDLTSAFLTALNATHSANVVLKEPTSVTLFRRLTLTNPCDDCASVDGAPLTIKIQVTITKDEDENCIMTGKITSNCGGCDMYYTSSGFGLGSDCEALTLSYVDPGFPRPEFNCCINGVGSTLTLNVP